MRFNTSFDIIIPSATISNVELTVNVLYYANDVNITSNDYINTGLKLTYVKNPVLDLLFPTTILADGGVTIYGKGSGFDIITNISLYVYVKIKGLNGIKVYENNYNESCYPVDNQEGKQIKCIWPNLNLTQILPTLNTSSVLERKRRQAFFDDRCPISNQSEANLTVETYARLIFDGYRYYRSLCDFPMTLVFKNPKFMLNDNLMIIKKMEDLKIQGEDVNVGVTIVDYNVRLTESECVVTDISSNFLNCVPPQKKPQLLNEESNKCYKWPGSLPVNIHLGRNTIKYFIGCADYDLKFWSQNVIIYFAAGSAILIMVLVVFITLCCLCIKKCKDRKLKQSLPTVNYIGREKPGYSRNFTELEENYAADPIFKTPIGFGFNDPTQGIHNGYLHPQNNSDYNISYDYLNGRTLNNDLYPSPNW